MEIDEQTYGKIKLLCAEGDQLANEGSLATAIQKYEDALWLVPEPKEQWHASTWILTAIGDTLFSMQRYSEAAQVLLRAMSCPEALGNPFIHLRLGQAQFELGHEVLAKDELARAYMGGGRKIFDGEDPKYFELVKRSLKPPLGGW